MRASLRDAALALLGGIALPVAAVAYLLALGYGLGGRPALEQVSPGLVLALAALGAGIAVAADRSLRVAPALAALALVVLPVSPLFAGPPPGPVGAFTVDALFTAVGFALLSAVEFGLRHPAAARRWLTPETRRAGLRGGVVAVAAVVGVHLALGLGWVTDGIVFTLVASAWMLGGAFVVGAAVAVAAARYGLVTPGAVVLLVAAVGVYDAWRFASSTAASVGPTLFGLSLVGWFLPLSAALLAGVVERAIKTRVRGAASA
jgi:hypothetical protein